jgi:ribosome-binding factor A
MMPFSRADRVAGLIQKILSNIIRKDIHDPRLKMTTITGVKMSRDLKFANIYFISAGGRQNSRAAAEGFTSAGGFIRRSLAGELNLRYMPELRFFYDESFDYGSRIDELLKSITTDDGSDHSSP